MSPEEKARLVIDEKLEQAGWVVQDKNQMNLFVSNNSVNGVAVREFSTNDGGEVDYALFIDGTPVGLIEAKAESEGLHLSSSAKEQNNRYIQAGLKGSYDKEDLRFIYEATNTRIEFTDLKDPKPRSRTIYCFHQPETLKELIDDFEYKGGKTLRGRLEDLTSLPPLDNKIYRDCQINAIVNLEQSFAKNQPRSLIQMATGAGKTFTAITSTYRLLKHAKVKRVLFLVDTKNLGAQAETEYKNFKPYDSNLKLQELYAIKRITSSNIPSDTQICISTIQRLYSMLKGDIASLDDSIDNEQDFLNESYDRDKTVEISYNKAYPPEFFDVIIIDECHRSIYNLWRQVLEYFDAFLVGLTATPNEHTYAFFNKNVVSEYTHEQAVNDGVNVGAFGTFIIETEKSKQGGCVVPMEQKIELRDKRSRAQRWESVDTDDELHYSASELDNSVVNRDQIRLVLTTFRDNWKKWIYFQDRTELPKTLIFAKNDSHAADITEIAKEVFGEGNDFCKKITYTSTEDEQKLLFSFRNEFNPRIAVTVSKIATGTDVKAIEILIFMRDIRSENYYEQMLGRARRTLSKEALIKSSPSAHSQKLGYVIVDAVGVTNSPKLSRGRCGTDVKPTTSFAKLMEEITVYGAHDEETYSSLGTRLERLAKVLTEKEQQKFLALTNNTVSIQDLATSLKSVHNEDEIQNELHSKYEDFDALSKEEQEKCRLKVIKERCKQAAKPLYNPQLRKFLMTVRSSNDQTIDPALDSLIHAGFTDEVNFSKENVRKTFKEFIDSHKDEIEALQIIYNQSYANRHLTEGLINDLYEQMLKYSKCLEKAHLFNAYEQNTKAKTTFKELVDIIQLIRFEWQQTNELIPFSDLVRQRFKEWSFAQNQYRIERNADGLKPFNPDQVEWLQKIRDYIAINTYFPYEALEQGSFSSMGGAAQYYYLFQQEWHNIIDDLNQKLVV